MITSISSDLEFYGDRYQVLKRLGGSNTSQVCVASDVRSGALVCLRLWPLQAQAGNWRTLPKLHRRPSSGPAALLPFAFGVHHSTAYTVRPFHAGTPLPRLWNGPALATLPKRVRLAADIAAALQMAHDSGFVNGDFVAEDVIVSAKAEVKLIGFDRTVGPATGTARSRDVSALCSIATSLLAGADDQLQPRQYQRLARVQRLLGQQMAAAAPSLASTNTALRRLSTALARDHSLPHQVSSDGAQRRGWRPVGRRMQRLGHLIKVYGATAALLACIVIGGYQLIHAPRATLQRVTLEMPANTALHVPANQAAPPVTTSDVQLASFQQLPASTALSSIPPAHDTVQFAGIDAQPAAVSAHSPASSTQRATAPAVVIHAPAKATVHQTTTKKVPATSARQRSAPTAKPKSG